MTQENLPSVFAQAGELANPADDIFAQVSSSIDFFPRIQLCSSKSDAVATGSIPVNHYALIKSADSLEDIGVEFDAVPVAWRPKAMDTTKDVPISSHDINSELFKEIRTRSGEQNSGCMYGPEFLLWVPKINQFVTFFFSSRSARREAPDLNTIMKEHGTATFKSKLVENSKYKWQVPVVIKCSTPVTNVPKLEELKVAIDKFINPPAPAVEVVPESQADKRDR